MTTAQRKPPREWSATRLLGGDSDHWLMTADTVFVERMKHEEIVIVREVLEGEPDWKAMCEKLADGIKKELKAAGDCCCGAEEQAGEGYVGVVCYLHEALAAHRYEVNGVK